MKKTFFRLVPVPGGWAVFKREKNCLRKAPSGPCRASLMPEIARLEYLPMERLFHFFPRITVFEIGLFEKKYLFGQKNGVLFYFLAV